MHAVEGDEHVSGTCRGRRGPARDQRRTVRSRAPPASTQIPLALHRGGLRPARARCGQQAEALAASALDTGAAISCNPRTFARDAATLIAGGFGLEREC